MTETQPKQCAWCGDRIAENGRPFGLTTRFRKDIELERDEVKVVPISIAHVDRTVPGYVRRKPDRPSDPALQLTFRTCSQNCARTLYRTLKFERRLFSVPMAG